ncbi:MAG: pyruvate carboxylase subunit B [Negativicutes bacterium]
MNTNPVRITETVLRDGHQSLAATRMSFSDMEPMLDQLDNVGYFSIEAWGGATFDSCLRFLNEDPWDRLRKLRVRLKKTPIQMLLRGQNLLGYSPYADDVVSEFIKRSVYNGVSIIRIFDALNDLRNLETSIKVAKSEGAHVQGAFVYTVSPFHTDAVFVETAQRLAQMGCNSICIKDMAGLLDPYSAEILVTDLKDAVNIPIQLHTHYTSGLASMTYLKAIEAGVDIIDCALSPFSGGSSQPATESIVAALKDQPRDTNIDEEKLYPIAKHFRNVKKELLEKFNLPGTPDFDVEVLKYQIPGGMLTNFMNQLKEMGIADKYQNLLEEMPRVRADVGYPPLVTPTSQIIGTQAALNVALGRYKQVPREFSDLALGKYGKTPAAVSEEFLNQIAPNEKPITCRPADLIVPQLDNIKFFLAEAGYPQARIDDVLSYAIFPDVALKYFETNR